ncbi:MAG: hypothetical protein IJW49_07485 [Clostridia bacterium]|nr:hypothetical protein [Clostridia bacterium]
MNKMKRIISTLLAVIMLLGSFAAFSTVGVSAASDDIDKVIQNTYVKDEVYNTPEEKLATMKKTFTRGNYELYVDEVSGEVATKDIRTGEILFTNPYDVAGSKGSVDTKSQLMSQIIVQYEDITTGDAEPLYSFKEAAMREQIKVLNIKNGVRVEYTIGQEATRKLVPRRISDQNFVKFIKTPLESAVNNGTLSSWVLEKFLANYKFESLANKKTQKLKDQILKKYPVLDKMDIWVFDEEPTSVQINFCETYIKNFCDDYTFEQMEADHAETGYIEEEAKYPLFKMALEYNLTDSGVKVTLPCNGLRYDMASYALESVSVLPYMGAGNSHNSGYNFFPDGAGELFDFEKLNNGYPTYISAQVYGADYAYHQLNTATDKSQKAVRYPVYGTIAEEILYTFSYEAPVYTDDSKTKIDHYESITETVSNSIVQYENIEKYVTDQGGKMLPGGVSVESYKRGFVAIIESGESLAKIETCHPGLSSDYNYMRNYFNPKPKDSYDVADSLSVGSSSKWTVVSDRKYTGNIVINYQMLTDPELAKNVEDEGYTYYETTWFGMAEAYRDHLVNSGTLSLLADDQLEENIPLYMEVFGAVETQEQIATIPVDVMTPLTTFDNILTMYTELSDAGIKNINFKMTGYANGGLGMATVPSDLEWEDNVGGANGFRSLVKKATAINSINGEHIGLYPDFDFAYIENDTWFDSTNLKDDAVRTIDNRYSSKRLYSSTDQSYVSFYQLAISPSRYSKFYEELLENYGEYGLKSMSVGSLGNSLNSDFDEDEPYNREDSKSYTAQAFQDMKNAGYSLMTESANAYTWGYVDHILNMDLDSSRHIKASASVPFLGVVLHGFVQFTGTPFNEEGDPEYAMLRALENGAALYFILSYQNTAELKEFENLSQYYSVRYDIWKEDVVSYYSELNGLLKDVQNKVIIDHRFLIGKRILDVDELEAELAEQLKDASEKETAAQEALITEKVLKIANAWKVAENAYDKIEDILTEMDSLNKQIFDNKKVLEDKVSKLSLEVEDALALMRPRIDAETGEEIAALPAAQATKDLVAYLNSLRTTTTDILKASAKLDALYEEGLELLATVAKSASIIEESELTADTKDRMVAVVKEYYEEALKLFNEGDSRDDDDQMCYSALQKRDKYKAYVTEGNAGYVVNTAVAALVAVKSDDPEEHANLITACEKYMYTADQLVKEGVLEDENQDTGIGDDNKDTTTDKFVVDNNQIVLVTYGDRDANTHVKNAYKSFILNYNNYAVVVEYEDVIYTIPRGGYVVLYHN